MNKIPLPSKLYDLYNLYHEQNYRHCLTEIKSEKYADNQLIYLSYINEAKIRFELAINHINLKKIVNYH